LRSLFFLKKRYTGDNSIRLLDQRYLPRWIVVLIDTFLCLVSMGLVYLVLIDRPTNFHDAISVPLQALAIIAVNITYFFIFKTYAGVIRYSTFRDLVKLTFSSLATATTVILINFGILFFYADKVFLTTSVLLYMLLSFAIMVLFRITVKESYQYLKVTAPGNTKKRVAIIGTDDHIISIGKALTTESNLPYQLVAFLTSEQIGKRFEILGKPVIPVKGSISDALDELDVACVLIVAQSFSGKERSEIVEQCIERGKQVLNVPSLEQWNKKEDIRNQIKAIKIEDLLERNPIEIDDDTIRNDLQNKTILVTGGAGSIGCEIVKQIAGFSPKLVVIIDQAESALHELELYLQLNNKDLKFITELADIRNMYRMQLLCAKYDIDIVYHAAAYKHVPIIERNPHEAIYANILGTVNLAVIAVNQGIDKFVMVSTDKAVNPTSVMGASKRAAEMYVQSLQNEHGVQTKFITTRFGNVLGSSGSVIPIFRKQIAQGGPVTVTHRDIIRYFMTIPEACQLVLQAGTMGKGGEIYVFDMGEPVRILDLAERMVRLAGLEPYQDIDIKITGLRPGEKLFEECLNDSATPLPTHNAKIMISKVPVTEFSFVKDKVKAIIRAATKHNDERVVGLLKELVPEYKSENSKFTSLDSSNTKIIDT